MHTLVELLDQLDVDISVDSRVSACCEEAITA